MASAASAEPSLDSIFQTKYDEFADELLLAIPELTAEIRAAVALSDEERLRRWQAEVKVPSETAPAAVNPGAIMPGVVLPDSLWGSLSETTRGAIWEFVRLLSMCCFLETGFAGGETKPIWMDEVMDQWKAKLEKVDFEAILGKFGSFFKSGSATDASGGTGAGMPKLPEKFLKGQIAKLAEEIIRDIKPEDLGLTPEAMAECEASPSRAFDIMIQLFTKNPGIIQKTIQKIGKRLQQKVQSGAIRPQEIAREAEELMKEFASNPEFVGMMDSLKGVFGMAGGDDDPDFAMPGAPAGSGSARLSAVKERLRRKMEARTAAAAQPSAAGGAGAGAAGGAGMAQPQAKPAGKGKKGGKK
jgi:hypothetical protein